jgi:hypothetical protein
LISEGIGKSSSTGEAAIGAATEGLSAAVRPASDLSFFLSLPSAEPVKHGNRIGEKPKRGTQNNFLSFNPVRLVSTVGE